MIVIDASVAVKLVTREPGAEAALARVSHEADRLVPSWIRIEVANALAKKVRNDGLPEAAAIAGLEMLGTFFTETIEALDLLDEAFALAVKTRHSIHDCVYLALALRRGAVVVTHDGTFARATQRAGFGANMELLG